MSYADNVARVGRPVSVSQSSTSYFSASSEELDSALFSGKHLRPHIRNGVLALLMDHLRRKYTAPDKWAVAWLAGSGVSYQWSAARQPGDLDCLVGVDYPMFRSCNLEYVGLSDTEISQMLNEEFNSDLMPGTANWNGYELTFYVNPGATDIQAINPYAAYNLTEDQWTVEPRQDTQSEFAGAWAEKAQRDYDQTMKIVRAYSQALTDVRATSNPAHRVNAESRLRTSVSAGESLYDEIHHGRKIAFSPVGEGYADFHNYRWQAGKQSGVVGALKKIKQYAEQARVSTETETYGLALPDTDTLIRRAAVYRQ